MTPAPLAVKPVKETQVCFDKIETKNRSIITKTKHDHRICMATAIISLATGIKTEIKNFETVNTSFPGFISLIKNLGGKIAIK